MATKDDFELEDIPETYVEIVKVEEGKIVLRRSDEPGAPLVTINFSEEAQDLLQGADLDVAQIMIHAGVQGFGQIQMSRIQEAENEAEEAKVLH